MAYPLDDNGNIRVDFVWGNVPMQPDEQRTDQSAPWVGENNQLGDRGWSAPSYGVTSDSLSTTLTQGLSLGDQSQDDFWQDPDTRSVSVPTIHDIATTGWNNFPAFRPNYEGDGDAGLEAIMPNLVGLGSDDFVAALQAAGFSGATGTTARYTGSTAANNGKVFSQTPAAGANVAIETQPELVRYVRPQVPDVVDFDSVVAAEEALELVGLVLGTVTTSTVGATAENNNWVKSQSIAAGTTVDGGTAVNLVEYDYVVASTTGPIAGLNRTNPAGSGWGLNGNDAVMYLTGRTVRPTIGTTITVSGTSSTKWNQNWTVVDVINNDSYNTGGTAVKITALDDISFATPDASSTGGTWTLDVTP